MSLLVSTTIECQGTTPKTSAAIDTSSTTLLVIIVGFDRAVTDVISVSDSKSNTWHALTAQKEAGFPANQIFYAWNPTVGSGHTFTLASALADAAASVLAFDNVQTSSDPFDVQNGATNSGSESQATGNVTPSTSFQLLVAGWCSGFARVPMIDSGFTIAGAITAVGVDYGCYSAYFIAPASGPSFDPLWSWVGQGASRSAVTIATFKTLGAPAVSGGVSASFVAG